MPFLALLPLLCGFIAALIAADKGRSPVGWFFGGLLFSAIGILVVAVLPSLKEQHLLQGRLESENQRLRDALRQEQLKNEAFRRQMQGRVDAHDRAIGVNTRDQWAPPETETEAGVIDVPPTPPEPDTSLWYYELAGQTRGPVSLADIKQMLWRNELLAETRVYTGELGEWKRVDQVSYFRSDIPPSR
jgi:uncharacterized protein DUF4339